MLFILGLIALIHNCADYLKQSVKQDIRLQVFVESKAQAADVIDLSRRIGALDGVDSVSITYKDNAALALERDLGEDLLTLLSENDGLNQIPMVGENIQISWDSKYETQVS